MIALFLLISTNWPLAVLALGITSIVCAGR